MSIASISTSFDGTRWLVPDGLDAGEKKFREATKREKRDDEIPKLPNTRDEGLVSLVPSLVPVGFFQHGENRAQHVDLDRR